MQLEIFWMHRSEARGPSGCIPAPFSFQELSGPSAAEISLILRFQQLLGALAAYWTHTGIPLLDNFGSGQVLFRERLYFALRGPRKALSRFRQQDGIELLITSLFWGSLRRAEANFANVSKCSGPSAEIRVK